MRVILLATAVALAAGVAGQQSNLDLVAQRRKADLALTPTATQISLLSSYIAKQDSNGTWPDVNYLAGCQAREPHSYLYHASGLILAGRKGQLADPGALAAHRCPVRGVVRAEFGCAAQLHQLERGSVRHHQGHELVVRQRSHQPGLYRQRRLEVSRHWTGARGLTDYLAAMRPARAAHRGYGTPYVSKSTSAGCAEPYRTGMTRSSSFRSSCPPLAFWCTRLDSRPHSRPNALISRTAPTPYETRISTGLGSSPVLTYVSGQRSVA